MNMQTRSRPTVVLQMGSNWVSEGVTRLVGYSAGVLLVIGEGREERKDRESGDGRGGIPNMLGRPGVSLAGNEGFQRM